MFVALLFASVLAPSIPHGSRGAGVPLGLPVRVQLVSASGGCFESVFSSTGLTRNDAEKFQGKSD